MKWWRHRHTQFGSKTWCWSLCVSKFEFIYNMEGPISGTGGVVVMVDARRSAAIQCGAATSAQKGWVGTGGTPVDRPPYSAVRPRVHKTFQWVLEPRLALEKTMAVSWKSWIVRANVPVFCHVVKSLQLIWIQNTNREIQARPILY